jgi:hypothetical protein
MRNLSLALSIGAAATFVVFGLIWLYRHSPELASVVMVFGVCSLTAYATLDGNKKGY